MLLRSNKENVHASRIELLFKNVGSFHLATLVSALEVRVVSLTEAEARVGKILVAPHHNQKVYLVRSAEGDGYVVAGAAFISEDTLEYFDPTGFSGSYLPGQAP